MSTTRFGFLEALFGTFFGGRSRQLLSR